VFHVYVTGDIFSLARCIWWKWELTPWAWFTTISKGRALLHWPLHVVFRAWVCPWRTVYVECRLVGSTTACLPCCFSVWFRMNRVKSTFCRELGPISSDNSRFATILQIGLVAVASYLFLTCKMRANKWRSYSSDNSLKLRQTS